MNRGSSFACQSGWLVLPFLTACATTPPAPAPFPRPDDAPAILASRTPAPQPPAPAQAPPRREPRNQLDFMFGGSYWENLGDLNTVGSGTVFGDIGDFDTWGWAFDFGYDRVIANNGQVDWSLGIESGWSSFESDSFGYYLAYSEIVASMWYVAPVVRAHFELANHTSLILGVGAGYYGFSIDELTTYYYGYWYGYDSRTLTRDDAVGGFASLAVDFGVSPGGAFRVENKVHIVDFTGLDSLLPSDSSVSGPIWTIEIGYVFKF